MQTIYDHCESCGEEIPEDEFQEVRINNTRINIFVCEKCAEDLESFSRVL